MEDIRHVQLETLLASRGFCTKLEADSGVRLIAAVSFHRQLP